MKIKIFSLGPLGTNCYVLSKEDQAIVIDPGGEANIVTDYLKDQSLTLNAILLTHAHYDHIGGVDELRKQHEVEVYMHELEKDWLMEPELNGSHQFLSPNQKIKTHHPEKLIDEGHHQIGSFEFDIIHTPGHSPGSISFIFPDEHVLISGDVLFHHGVGRTDLIDGSLEELANSIINKIYKLPGAYTVYPGHGPSTTIETEKNTNPYTNQF